MLESVTLEPSLLNLLQRAGAAREFLPISQEPSPEVQSNTHPLEGRGAEIRSELLRTACNSVIQ